MLRWLIGIVLLAAVVAGTAYVIAGRGAPPQIVISKPDRAIGQSGSLEVTVEAPNARLNALAIAVEQNGKTTPLFALENAGAATVTQIDRNHMRVSRALGKQSVPELQSGAARVVVTATRPSFLNLRKLTATASKEIRVRLEPPRVAIVSTHHYVNHGGSELVVYRATPPDVSSGVRVGEVEYSGFPIPDVRPTASAEASAVKKPDATTGTTDPSLKAAFFALLWDQDLRTPIQAFARDEAGNE